MAIPGNFLSTVTESIDPNTSGWTAKLNCAIGLGSGGRNGDGTLKVTSTTSGAMQARTVSSYKVQPLTVYEALADASGATVPERIGIRWLSQANAEISITWSLTTDSASTTWHRIAVAGPAPSGAVYAQVIVSSSPAAGGVVSYFENVYFGYPISTVGNLLGFNTETAEISSDGWFNEVNSGIQRTVPPVSWPVNNYVTGAHVITMNALAAGNASIRSTDRPVATPGTEYVAYLYLNPPTSTATVWVELRFYDAAGTQISATRAVLAQPGTGWYRQIVSAAAPAATATCSIAAGIDSATTGQVLRVDGAVVSTAPVLYAGSVLPYADASFEQGTAGWSVTSGAATIARSTPWGTFPFDGSYSGTISSTTATASVIRSAAFPLPAQSGGQTFRIRAVSQVTAGSWTLSRGIRWYDATGTDLGVGTTTATVVPTPNWWSLSNDLTAPAGATQASIEYSLTATTTNSVLRVDQIGMWTVQPNIVVTTSDDTASITLTLRELIAGLLLTVYRVLADGTRTLVRGPDGLLDSVAIVSDLLITEDYEAPLGAAVYYAVECRDSTGKLIDSRTSATVTLAPPDVNWAWLKDPGQPQRNLMVMVAKAPDWSRSVVQAEYRVRGRRNSVVLTDVRGGLEGDLQIFTQSDAERAALHWLLDSGGVLLWQAAPGNGISDMYVSVADITETRGGGIASDPLRTWTLPLKQADMPTAVGIAGSAGRTWQDILSEFATWGDVHDAFATWEDVQFNRRIGG